MPIRSYLGSFGLHVSSEWAQAAEPRLDGAGKERLACAMGIALECDFRRIGIGAIPAGIARANYDVLEGPLVLQVEEGIDISEPLQQRYSKQKNWQRRMLRLRLTDGVEDIHGMERSPLTDLDNQPRGGLKVAIYKAPVRRGYLQLSPSCCRVLGGRVESLESARRKVETHVLAPPQCPRAQSADLQTGLDDAFTIAAQCAWSEQSEAPQQRPLNQPNPSSNAGIEPWQSEGGGREIEAENHATQRGQGHHRQSTPSAGVDAGCAAPNPFHRPVSTTNVDPGIWAQPPSAVGANAASRASNAPHEEIDLTADENEPPQHQHKDACVIEAKLAKPVDDNRQASMTANGTSEKRQVQSKLPLGPSRQQGVTASGDRGANNYQQESLSEAMDVDGGGAIDLVEARADGSCHPANPPAHQSRKEVGAGEDEVESASEDFEMPVPQQTQARLDDDDEWEDMDVDQQQPACQERHEGHPEGSHSDTARANFSSLHFLHTQLGARRTPVAPPAQGAWEMRSSCPQAKSGMRIS